MSICEIISAFEKKHLERQVTVFDLEGQIIALNLDSRRINESLKICEERTVQTVWEL